LPLDQQKFPGHLTIVFRYGFIDLAKNLRGKYEFIQTLLSGQTKCY